METYKWDTIKAYGSNEEAMSDYLDNHLLQCFNVIFKDGTYAEIQNKNTGQIFRVSVSGNGDFMVQEIKRASSKIPQRNRGKNKLVCFEPSHEATIDLATLKECNGNPIDLIDTAGLIINRPPVFDTIKPSIS